MKILFLAPRFMLPADTGGKIRTFNLIKQIARFAEVSVVTFSFDPKDSDYLGEFEKMGIKVTLIRAQEGSFFSKVKFALNSMPFAVAKYYSAEFARTVRLIIDKDHFDCVHVDHIHMAQYQNCFSGLPCLVDEHNVEYKILERCGNVERTLWKQHLYFQQAGKMRKFESRIIPKFSACTAVSEDDAQVLKELTCEAVAVEVLPNGVDTEFFVPDYPSRPETQEEALVFTGSMDWLPNEDAILYFVNEILPLIWQGNPQIKFYIVGKSPAPRVIQACGNDPRIIITGRVDDVRPYLTRSKIFVTPLRIGGGTRLKILEALSMEKAIVSTSIGAEGIDYREDQNIVIANRPQEFANKVLALMAEPQTRALLGKSGRQLVIDKYDWKIVGKKLESTLRGLTYDQKK